MLARAISLTTVLIVALAAPAVAGAYAPASARALHCSAARGLPAADFEGEMKAVRGTHRMGMHFEVQEQLGSAPWTRVEAPALRRWRRSSPRVGSFSFVQRVENLRLEGAYRVQVKFRWFDRSGEVIREARRSSDACPAAEPAPLG